MKQCFIVDGVRTPVGSFKGMFSGLRADDLAAVPLAALMEKYKELLPAQAVEDVIMGCVNQAGEDNRNVARMALLLAGLPYTVPGETVNRLCASGMSSVVQAKRAIQVGDADVLIAGGVEHMTRNPLVMSKAGVAFDGNQELFDSSFGWRFINPKMKAMYGTDAMGETAENLVDLYNISREDQDRFAYNSQMKAAAATANGKLANEICSVTIPQKKGDAIVVTKDEFIKPNTSLEVLAKLKPAFRTNGTVTAGNASGLNDGAAALMLASDTAVEQYGLKPLAKIISSHVTGVEPRIMGIGPVEAANKALAKTGIGWNDVAIIELNEAFAAQSLACIRQWGLADDDARINRYGGAIAIGHPLGMSGARIILSAAKQLQEVDGKYALCTMCIGVGQGYAVVLEKV